MEKINRERQVMCKI